jgi:hypothetical protein
MSGGINRRRWREPPRENVYDRFANRYGWLFVPRKFSPARPAADRDRGCPVFLQVILIEINMPRRGY